MPRLLNVINPLTGDPFRDRTLWYEYYDVVSQGTAITAGLSFLYFSVIQSATKSLALTNMTTAGQLPNNQAMSILKMGVEIPADTAEVDMEHYQEFVTFTLTVDQTKVWEGPVSSIPSGFGLSGVAAGTGTPSALMINLGPAAPQATEVITPPIDIFSGSNIVGTMTHHNAITLAAAVTPRVYLQGFLDQAITN